VLVKVLSQLSLRSTGQKTLQVNSTPVQMQETMMTFMIENIEIEKG